MPDKVTERLILDALAEHPEFIEDWQIWSEDKRTDGWYWLKNEDGNYSVKRSINGVGIVESLSFSDAAHACAAFIKRDVEASRLRAIRSSN